MQILKLSETAEELAVVLEEFRIKHNISSEKLRGMIMGCVYQATMKDYMCNADEAVEKIYMISKLTLMASNHITQKENNEHSP